MSNAPVHEIDQAGRFPAKTTPIKPGRKALGRKGIVSAIALTLLVPIVVVAGSGSAASAAPLAKAAALPAVNMEVVVVAAQVEPRAGNQTAIGDGDGTTLVQKALKARVGVPAAADGWFGQQTLAAYTKWQQRLGYSGLDANGIPGPTSLTKLGEQRFTVTRPISVGGRTSYGGKVVNQRTRNMLATADARVSWSISLSQGSYNPGGENASAGTHDGGGAVDISVGSMTTTQRWQTIQALRTVGFAAWLRNPSQADWPWHIHAVAIGDTDMSLGAANQVADYYVGKNGLASHAPDDTPTQYRAKFTWWEAYQRGQ